MNSEGNVLIAEFMGWEHKEQWHPKGCTALDYAWHTPLDKPSIAYSYTHEHLYFDKLWDWIIPVVKKIKSNSSVILVPMNGIDSVMPYITACKAMNRGLIQADIEKVYNGCISFINWFHSQSKNK